MCRTHLCVNYLIRNKNGIEFEHVLRNTEEKKKKLYAIRDKYIHCLGFNEIRNEKERC